jgi:cellulose synthase/poly-beta-1,6-N-acetylglucosamine synthase-like glycosyltransferase
VRGQGFNVRYVGSAITYNKGPDTIRDFLKQRRRIYAGHLALRDDVGYRVSTLSGGKILALVLRHMEWNPRSFVWTWAVAGLEAYGRLLGKFDYLRRRDHSVWEISKTTKQWGYTNPRERGNVR